jgi:hypothetical protein
MIDLSAVQKCNAKWVVKEERMYTVAEVAYMTGFSRQTVTRLFEHEPGVLIITRPGRMHIRCYRSFRILNAVYEKVIRRLTVK